MSELTPLLVVIGSEKAAMFRPTEAQTGAFFGILASALMLLLTAMAVNADHPRPPSFAPADGSPAGGGQRPGQTNSN
jgi:hypothetical protein